MNINGLDFLFTELQHMTHGVCAACERMLPEQRTRQFTCDDICHRVWIDRLIVLYGDEKILTDGVTGIRYRVPTRVILETGIKASDLPTYPRVES